MSGAERCPDGRARLPRVHPFKLELLRQGPAHNQLMSPITPYLALSGNAPPQTLYFPFEHRQLLSRLGRLRQADRSMPPMEREAVLRDLGEPLGQVLGQVPSLYAAMTRDEEPLLHLQLSLSALELSMLPFEAMVAPDHFPGGNKPMLLHSPVVVTREVRRSQRAEVRWNRPPRVLFAFASPGGLAPVPAQDHLNALRRAIEPLVRRNDKIDAQANKTERLLEVSKLLQVLPDASLRTLTDACRNNAFTHVHILAHGLPIDLAGGSRYGMALCRDGDPLAMAPVDAAQLVNALRGGINADDGCMPTLVSLATCDSGAVDSVIMPGGSLAHELHEAGVPWVVASQFPLWMDASVLLAESLYAGLLVGNDPRRVLLGVRRRLAAEVPETFDWASLVAYATIPFDIDRQVSAFRDRQTRQQLEVKFSAIDEMLALDMTGPDLRARIAPMADGVREILRRSSVDDGAPSAAQRAEWLGMAAASEKRLGLAYQRIAAAERRLADMEATDSAAAPGTEARRRADEATARADEADQRSREAYDAARDKYREAMTVEPLNHWVTTQYLSMAAVGVRADAARSRTLADAERDRWQMALVMANFALTSAVGTTRAWALGTRAELVLLGCFYDRAQHDPDAAAVLIRASCAEIVQLTGLEAFEVASTRRQFQRYRTHWADGRAPWAELAQAALDTLAGPEKAVDELPRIAERKPSSPRNLRSPRSKR